MLRSIPVHPNMKLKLSFSILAIPYIRRWTRLRQCQHPREFNAYRYRIYKRQVQKSDRINSDRQSGSDQLGSTRIDSDRLESRKKQKIKLNIETITHFKVKFGSKMDQIKKDSRGFSVWCCVVKPPFCIL